MHIIITFTIKLVSQDNNAFLTTFNMFFLCSVAQSITLPNVWYVGQTSQLQVLLGQINSIVKCKTPYCNGEFDSYAGYENVID